MLVPFLTCTTTYFNGFLRSDRMAVHLILQLFYLFRNSLGFNFFFQAPFWTSSSLAMVLIERNIFGVLLHLCLLIQGSFFCRVSIFFFFPNSNLTMELIIRFHQSVQTLFFVKNQSHFFSNSAFGLKVDQHFFHTLFVFTRLFPGVFQYLRRKACFFLLFRMQWRTQFAHNQLVSRESPFYRTHASIDEAVIFESKIFEIRVVGRNRTITSDFAFFVRPLQYCLQFLRVYSWTKLSINISVFIIGMTHKMFHIDKWLL